MKISTDDLKTNEEIWYMPLSEQVFQGLLVSDDHDTAMWAIWLAFKWFKDPDADIDFASAAEHIAKWNRDGKTADEICRILQEDFMAVARSVRKWVEKRELSQKRRDAGKRGMKSRWGQ